MNRPWKFIFAALSLMLLVVAVPARSLQSSLTQAAAAPSPTAKLEGRWRVKFVFAGRGAKNLILDAKDNGAGAFLLLDTEPDDKPRRDPLPAAWSQLTNDRVSFSGEVELPIGTCCREIGTLLFKGKFASHDSLTGKVIFVTSVDEEENPYQFRSLIGAFTATRISSR